MEIYANEAQYVAALEKRAALPDGFKAATVPISFFPKEIEASNPYSMNVSAIVLDKSTPAFAATLTRNLFPGAPIRIMRERLNERNVRGILINNRISNVCTESGVKDAEKVLEEFGRLFDVPASEMLPASTGIIGWRLPVDEMVSSLPILREELKPHSILGVARGIMTTDLYPKVRAAEVGEGRIVGIAKGAGMIEPNMATLLVFLLTDLSMEREELRNIHGDVIERTFNRISVDSDQSTSDMSVVLSSGAKPSPGASSFRDGLYAVCKALAEDVVRNGEGTSHVIRAVVTRAPDQAIAVGLGKAVINSPLVKTAVFGDDPNVGRVVMAVGDFLGSVTNGIDPGNMRVSIGGYPVFEKGSFSLDNDKETAVNRHMREARLDPEHCRYPAHNRLVEIEIDLDSGAATTEVTGSDLSYEYVRENADYRT